jgi:hypothetical protein
MCTLHENMYTFKIVSRRFLLRMRNVSDEVVEKIKTNILRSVTFPKIVPLWNNVEKYGTAREATDDNMAHAHCKLGS